MCIIVSYFVGVLSDYRVILYIYIYIILYTILFIYIYISVVYFSDLADVVFRTVIGEDVYISD